MDKRNRRAFALIATLLFSQHGEGTTPTAPSASRKWVGPEMPSPDGGRVRTTIYYGPWQCRQTWVDDCQVKCNSRGRKSLGCIWIADIKSDLQTRFLGSPLSAGGHMAINHCCCDDPPANDQAERRNKWENGIDSFRRKWAKEFGQWPTESDGSNWPGHHIWDIKHGGDPIAERNVLPVPPETHKAINTAYSACYSGKGNWSKAGPYWPYAD